MDIARKAALAAWLSVAIASLATSQETAASKPQSPEPPIQSVFNTWFHCHYSPTTRDQIKAEYEKKVAELGPEHLETLKLLESYTNACAKLSDVSKLVANRELILEKRKAALGEDHPLVLESMGLLADAYISEVEFAKGFALAEATLEKYRRVLGPDHLDTLAWSRIVADYLGESGQLAKSRTLLEATLKKQIELLGEESPETLRSKLLLSRCMSAAFELKPCRELREAVHTLHLKTLGPKHPEAIESMFMLAKVYAQQGDYANAMPIMTEALQFAGRVFPEESDAMSLLSDAAFVLREAGYLHNASQLLQRELSLRTKLLGPEHRKTLLVQLELGKLRFVLGEVEESKKEIEATLEKLRPKLAPTDLRIWNAEITLGNIQLKKDTPGAAENMKAVLDRSPIEGEQARAIQTALRDSLFAKIKSSNRELDDPRPVFQAGYDVFVAKLGPNHPYAFRALADIAKTEYQSRDYPKALELYEELFKKSESKLGALHADTLDILESLILAYEAVGQGDKSIQAAVQLGERRTRALGPNNIRTLRTYVAIAQGFMAINRFDNAESILKQVLERQKDRSPDDLDKANTTKQLGIAYLNLGKSEEALKLYQPVYDHFLKSKGPKDEMTLRIQGSLAEALFASDKTEEGVKQLDLLLTAAREVYASDPLKLAGVVERTGLVALRGKSLDFAEKCFRESLTLCETKGATQWEQLAVSTRLGDVLVKQGKYEEAEKRLVASYESTSKSRDLLDEGHQYLIAYAANLLSELYSTKGDRDNAAKWKTAYDEEVERGKLR